MKHAEPEVSADALNRANRTFLQGLAITALFTIATVLNGALSGTDPEALLSWETWRFIALLALKDVLVACTSYIIRRSEH